MNNIVWGTLSEDDNIVWGTLLDGDNIVWGTALFLGNAQYAENIVWGTAADWDDNIVWGTGLLGTFDGDNTSGARSWTVQTTSCGAPSAAKTSCGEPPGTG
jgi:hypothetical protein